MSFANNIRGVNQKTKDFLVTRENERMERSIRLRRKAESEKFLRELPKKTLELTESNHDMTKTMLEEIQAYFWSDPDVHTQIEDMLKEENEYHEQQVQRNRERLGWKTTKNDATSQNIRWTD